MAGSERKVAVGFVLVALAAGAIISGQFPDGSTELAAQKRSKKTPPPPDRGMYSHRFPDANADYIPPKDQYKGRLFRLSQDFPRRPAKWDSGLKKIMRMPFGKKNDAWKSYLMAVRDYCFEGNIGVEFQGQDNQIRSWYHVPWQHWGSNGREGIHGLTKEATAKPQHLAPEQEDSYQTYAVGLYNEVGGYTIGNVWRDQMAPDATVAKFPVGTIVFKILFTQAPPSAVPYLKNPQTWQAYADHQNKVPGRVVQNLNLIQMDIMVRDDRVAETGGWLFGNFCYNGELNRKVRWENLVPVGIAWGDDPTVTNEPRKFNDDGQPFPPETTFNPELMETIINPGKELPQQHLGYGARLNGPVDYFNSSCMSCHSTAQYPAVAPLNPDFTGAGIKPGSKAWMKWFRNVPCGTAFSPGAAYSMDYSLQLAASLQNFYEWKSGTQKGYFNPEIDPTGTDGYSQTETAPLVEKAPAAPPFAAPQAVQIAPEAGPVRRVFQIRRDAGKDD